MKITKQISLLLLVMITAFACEDLDELTEFDINGDLSTSFSVAVTEDSEGMPAEFSENSTIDLASNVDIQSSIDLIQGVTVNDLTYEIDNFEGAPNATLTEGTFTFGSTTISITDVNLEESDDNNTVYTIEDAAALNAIASALANESSITASVNGTVSGTPVSFDILLELDVTTTVDVL
ncbi:MAG: hypothetical protein AB8B52_07130 [Winogradskyella sp.]|uniref:hypothetical protein n=1 Tax=Winogradskyella sp. TaxID=1883156 RepID=UPI00385C55D6